MQSIGLALLGPKVFQTSFMDMESCKVNWQPPKYPMFTASRMKILGRMDSLALCLPSWSPYCRETFGGKRISYDGRNFQWTNATLVCRIWKQAKSRNLSDSAGTRFLQTSWRSKGTNETFSCNFHTQWQIFKNHPKCLILVFSNTFCPIFHKLKT